MSFVKVSFGLFVSLLILGCVHSNGDTYLASKHPDINYEFLGVPLLFSGYGSSVPITSSLSLTAAHVAILGYDEVIAYHPHCDIAIIETNNAGLDVQNTGLVYQGEPVFTYGVDASGNVLTSEGKYFLDLKFINLGKYAECPLSITDAPIQGGMSGGAAINNSGELVGIITAIANQKSTRLTSGEVLDIERMSIFVSTAYIKPWLESEIALYNESLDLP